MSPPPPRPPLILFLDFDGTLTNADTLAALASIPYALRSAAPSPEPYPPPLPPFSHFSTAYLSARAAHTAAYYPPAAHRTTPGLELAFLASQRGVEEASVRRVEAAGLFRGVRRAHVVSAAERMVASGDVRVRDGWAELLRHVRARDARAEVCVVSVSWSRAWIRGVLDAGLRAQGGKGTLEGWGVGVVANEVLGLDEGEGGEGGGEGGGRGEGGVERFCGGCGGRFGGLVGV
ncbi:hypothetical protein MMC18_000680 [Xylographa bjoerkii]|nr:hypothetical protein [Xylographa bjoerkii]